MAADHIHRIRNSSIKAARIARAVVDLKTITTDDIAAGFLKRPDIQAAVLRAIVVRDKDRRSPSTGKLSGGGKPIGAQRWDSASREIWEQVEVICIAFLEDVDA